ncbi:MAG: hypothetical protein ABSF70_12190 [Terracidiphilus sp.]
MKLSSHHDDGVPQVSNLKSGITSCWHRFAGPAIILLAAAIAIAPQLIHGPSCGHDFDFHLVSWFDCLNSWRHGVLYPHWTASANYGAGEPRFIFYPPLTWMLGAALGLVLPWTRVPIAMTFLFLAGTGLATRALARQALDDGAATLAGCAAIFSGYTLFTAYERTAFAEFAGGCWIPLVLLYLLRESAPSANTLASPAPASVWRSALDASIVPLAVAVAGAWLANPTVGVMACYLLVVVALTRALLLRSLAVLVRAAAGTMLGMSLVAAYLIPAAWERRWVDILQVTEDPGQTLENNWLFAVHANPALRLHDEVLRTASIIAVVMIAVALGGLLVSRLRGRLPAKPQWWIPLALIPIIVLVLQFPVSHALWNLLPELRFLQFPWRWLLVLEAPMAIFFASAVWPPPETRLWRHVAVAAACIAVFLAMTLCADRVFFQGCDDAGSVTGMLQTYRAGQGFQGTGEYEPIGADNSLVSTSLPQACLVADSSTVLGEPPAGAAISNDPDADVPNPIWSAGQGSCAATFTAQLWQPEHKRLRVVIPDAGFLVLRLRSYPAWRIAVNGQLVSDLPQRDDGLIAVPVPQGPIDLAVDWTTTTDVLAGRWLSVLAALLLAALWFLERRLSRSRLS